MIFLKYTVLVSPLSLCSYSGTGVKGHDRETLESSLLYPSSLNFFILIKFSSSVSDLVVSVLELQSRAPEAGIFLHKIRLLLIVT